jgi:Right handed beta helix region/HYR domain
MTRASSGWRLAIRVSVCAGVLGLTAPKPITASSVLLVPEAYPTIQAAIDAAAAGDTVRVGPGTYNERIDFRGKTIVVESTAGAAATIIQPNGAEGAIVTISLNGAFQSPVLRGFTLRGGVGDFWAGGIYIAGGSPLVENNVVTGNSGCLGGGITVQFSAATIRKNTISNNTMPLCSGGNGGGIRIGGAGTAQVLDNVISGNRSDTDGGGIALFAAGQPTVTGNVIRGNVAENGTGGGISLSNVSDALITNNIITSNRASRGGGIGWLVPSGNTGPRVVNNTLALNTAPQGSAVFADGFDAAARLVNNVIFSVGDAWPLECSALYAPAPPIIRHNDVFNVGGPGVYGGACADHTGVNGNISIDPLFVSVTGDDFHLQAASPAIDAGESTGVPTIDIDGEPRPVDGDGDGVAVPDMGADEAAAVIPGDTMPPTISVPGTVYADATMPSGALVNYSVLVDDDTDPAPVLVCTPASGTQFPMLSTTVNCTVTDASGNDSTASFTVVVRDADGQLADTAALIQSWSLGKTGRTLLSRIDTIRRSLAAGKKGQACTNLNALLADITAFTNKGLTPAQASELRTRVVRITAVVGC